MLKTKNTIILHVITLGFIIFLSNSIYAQEADTIEVVSLFELSLEELMDIKVVSASKTSQRIYKAPAIIDVISEREIREKGFHSVSEALKSIPGLFVTTDHVTYNASIRGINGGREASSRNIKIMIDGQPVSYRPTSENFIGAELIPMNMIKQIEVIKGPASALYGANAFLGVVNIITKTGKDLKNSSLIKYGNGTISNNSFEFVSGYSENIIDFTIGITAEKIDRSGLKMPYSTLSLKERINFEYPGISPLGQETEHDISRPLVTYGTFTVKPSFGTFKTSIHCQELNNNGRFYDINPVLNNNRINIFNCFMKESFNGDYLNDKLSVNLSVAYASGKILKSDILDYHPEIARGFRIKREQGYKSVDLVSELSYLISKDINFMVGVDNINDNHDLLSYQKIIKLTNDTLDPVITRGDDVFNNMGIYSQIIWTFSKKGALTGGLRHDNHNIYGEKLNYRFGAVYEFSKYLHAKLLYGTSFRAPTPAQLFSPYPPYNADDGTIGNSDLIPESAQTFEASLGSNPFNGLSFQVNGFYNLIDSIIIIEREGGLSKPINQSNITSYGGEFITKWKINSFSGTVNLSYQYSTTTNKEGYVEDVKLFPNLMAGGNINYSFKNLNLNIQSHFIDEYIASQNNIKYNTVLGKPEIYNIEKYFVTNLTLSSKKLYLIREDNNDDKKETIVSLSMKNIFDKEYSYPGFYKYDIPALGRTIMITITQIF